MMRVCSGLMGACRSVIRLASKSAPTCRPPRTVCQSVSRAHDWIRRRLITILVFLFILCLLFLGLGFTDTFLYGRKYMYDYRVLLIVHLSGGVIEGTDISLYPLTFASMLHGSWTYVINNHRWARDPNHSVKVDLLVYYSPLLDPELLPWDCPELTSVGDLVHSVQSVCVRTPCAPEYSPNQTASPSYYMLGQFCFLSHKQLPLILNYYHFVARTDPDTFLTPAFFQWRIPPSVEIVIGHGGYASKFSSRMLDKIASEKLNWTRQGLRKIGSTWLVKSEHFLAIWNLTLFATSFVYENAFNVSLFPEIARYVKPHEGNFDGRWPDWWRPVSLLYGGDLAVQQYFPRLSADQNQPRNGLDCYSDHPWLSVDQARHIHAFHTSRHFSKFRFFDLFLHTNTFCTRQGQLNESGVRQYAPLRQMGALLPRKMKVSSYTAFISMAGAFDYFRQNGCY